MPNKPDMQMRCISSQFATRSENDDIFIECYFAVFDSDYELWKGATESIAPGTFSETLVNDDIRALIDHDTRLVLGRTKSGTLELREDSKGLWGRIKINRNDSDAMNLYERVKRGDVDQCSFGFEILDQECTEWMEGGTWKHHWTIKKVNLYEVSIVTFPAYEETSASARKKDFEEIKKRKSEAWKIQKLKQLKGE